MTKTGLEWKKGVNGEPRSIDVQYTTSNDIHPSDEIMAWQGDADEQRPIVTTARKP